MPNIEEYLSNLFKVRTPDTDPQILQTLDPIFLSLKKVPDIEVLEVNEDKSKISVNFKVPFRFDPVNINLIYDVNAHHINLNFKFFKELNHENSMRGYLEMISKLSWLECQYVGGEMKDSPIYNRETHSLDFSWKFRDDNIEVLSKFIPEIMKRYNRLNIATYEPSNVHEFFKQYQNSGIDISASLQNLPGPEFEKIKKMVLNYVTQDCGRAKEIPYQKIFLTDREQRKEIFFTLIKNSQYNTTTLSLPLLQSFFETLSERERIEVLSHRDANNDNALTLAAYTCKTEVINYILSKDTDRSLQDHRNNDGLNYQDISVFQLIKNCDGKGVINALENKNIDFNLKNHVTGWNVKQSIAHKVFDIVAYDKLDETERDRVNLLEKLLGTLPQEIVNQSMLYQGQMKMNAFSAAIPFEKVPNHDLLIFDWLIDHYSGDQDKMLAVDCYKKNYRDQLGRYMENEIIYSKDYEYMLPFMQKYALKFKDNSLGEDFLNSVNYDHLDSLTTLKNSLPNSLFQALVAELGEKALKVCSRKNGVLNFLVMEMGVEKCLAILSNDSMYFSKREYILSHHADPISYSVVADSSQRKNNGTVKTLFASSSVDKEDRENIKESKINVSR